ncbi:MAG: c-type cytochrome [Pararhodobacter sp.]
MRPWPLKPRARPGQRCAALLVALGLGLPLAAQDLVGHGGPVGALAARGDAVLSGSFDTRTILWDSMQGRAVAVQRFHEGNVTAVAFLTDGRLATGGQDGRIALWQRDARSPDFATPAASAPVAALSAAPDGLSLVAAFWDGALMELRLADLQMQREAAHHDRITGLGHLPDGRLVSVGSDRRFMLWRPGLQPAARADLPDLPNGLAISHGRVAVVFADGALRLFSPEGDLLPERFLTDRPLISVAAGDGLLAAAAIDGTVWLLESAELAQRAMIDAGQGPVWSLALSGGALLTGGGDGVIRRWALRDGSRLGSAGAALDTASHDDGSRGAEVWRACAVCHSLEPDDASRAGPSLHGVLGRPIASAPGYDYSAALRDLDIVWSARTVAELFEYGPEAYTPGSRMPEQRLSDPADRAALVAFLARFSD